MTDVNYRSWLEDQLQSIIPEERERGWVIRALIEDGPVEKHDHDDYQWASDAINQLRKGVPVQYVTGKAHFFGLALDVNPHTLIPRPETEELVELAVKLLKEKKRESACILDIGTGSGCIALALKDQLPYARIQAWDISPEALAVARINSRTYGLEIDWHEQDALRDDAWSDLSGIDLLISNPPYIARSEKRHMDPGVLAYEPQTALFASGNDPLIFYRVIARQGQYTLVDGGIVLCECSTFSAREVASIFVSAGYQQVEIIQDLQGLDRFCMAVWMDQPPAGLV